MTVPLTRRARSRAGTLPHRVATLSVHTSPLEQPGTGDAGGMNVYVVEVARRLAAMGIEIDIFTRATSSGLPPAVELAAGVTVRHVIAGPFEGLGKQDLPAQLCAFAAGVLRAEASREPGHYDLVHSHYWLSGQVGWLAAERWRVPLVHSMHTMAKVKNAYLAAGDVAEPPAREIGEAQVVDAADRLIASTEDEARQLVELYGADPARVATVPPGVDLGVFCPGSVATARARLGLRPDAVVLLFAGRIQPLKAPDLLVGAAARLLAEDPALRSRLVVAVVGGPSGSGLAEPDVLRRMAARLDIADVVRFEPPVPQPVLADWFRAATVCVVPSYTESFGLVAIEAQACGTPVVAADVGGLRTVVAQERSGLLVPDQDAGAYAAAVRRLLRDEALRRRLSVGAVERSARFSWTATAAGVLETYVDALAERDRPVSLAQ